MLFRRYTGNHIEQKAVYSQQLIRFTFWLKPLPIPGSKEFYEHYDAKYYYNI